MKTELECVEDLPERMRITRVRLKDLSDEELRQYLAERLQMTADNLADLAMAIREFEERGLDLSGFKTSLMQYLRRIAYGQTLPQVVAMFAGHRGLLQRVAFLPIPDQRRCVEQEGMVVASGVLADGTIDVRHKPLLSMEPVEVRQVFGPAGVRNPQEQIAWVKSQVLPTVQPAIERPSYVIEHNVLVVNRPTRLTKRDLQNILKAM